MDNLPVLDEEKIGELREVMGIDFVDLIDTYLRDSLRKINCLTDALPLRDWKILEMTAHNLRGSSSNIGAETMAYLGAMLEQAAQQCQVQDTELLLARIKNAFQACEEEFMHAKQDE